MTPSRTLVVWIYICPMPRNQFMQSCKSPPPISATSMAESPTDEKTREVVEDVTDTAVSSAKPVDIAENEVVLLQVRNSSFLTVCLSSN